MGVFIFCRFIGITLVLMSKSFPKVRHYRMLISGQLNKLKLERLLRFVSNFKEIYHVTMECFAFSQTVSGAQLFELLFSSERGLSPWLERRNQLLLCLDLQVNWTSVLHMTWQQSHHWHHHHVSVVRDSHGNNKKKRTKLV